MKKGVENAILVVLANARYAVMEKRAGMEFPARFFKARAMSYFTMCMGGVFKWYRRVEKL